MTIGVGVIGTDHDHIHGQLTRLQEGGARLVGYFEPDDALAAAFAARWPDAPRFAERDALLGRADVRAIACAAVPADRAAICVDAMWAGKDVLVDKPACTTLEQLATLRAVQAETGRRCAILFSEIHSSRATVRALQMAADGAIGRVFHVVGLGPHRLRKAERPGWFFERARYGGIIADIASHQAEQFLMATGAATARVLSARVANRAHPDRPGLQDVGDFHLETDAATGLFRVDWHTPDGMPVWGDGRLMLTGDAGTIEVRKTVDLDGRSGGDHLILVDRAGVRRIDASGDALPFGPRFVADIRDRTETAQPQDRAFMAMEIVLRAQALAEETA